MEFQDLSTPRTYRLVFELTGNPAASTFNKGLAHIRQHAADVFIITQGEVSARARLEQARAASGFYGDMACGAYMLACITFCAPGAVLHATVTAFTGLIEDFNFSGKNTPLLIAYAEESPPAGVIVQDLTLKDELTGERFLLLAPLRPSFHPGESTAQDEPQSDLLNGFYLVGREYCLRVRRVERNGFTIRSASLPKGKRQAQRLRETPGHLYLVKSSLVLKKPQELIGATMRDDIERRIRSGNSYIDVWEKYTQAAQCLICRKARRFCLPASITEVQDTHVTLSWEKSADCELPELKTACVLYAQKPAWVTMSEQETASAWAALEAESDTPSALLHGELLRHAGCTAVLKAEDTRKLAALTPGTTVHLLENMSAHVKPLQRCRLAHQSIHNGVCANQFLSSIIDSESPYRATPPKGELIPARSPFIDRKFHFDKRPPTANQEKAIEIALNTPDIALIQGPPGTGKTTVITAILERLNELQDMSVSITGKVLVTSFQHDAVENLIDRLSINSLPTIKFGRRLSEQERSDTIIAESVDKWCRALSRNMEKRYPHLGEESPLGVLSNLAERYRLAPSRHLALQLVEKVRMPPELQLPESVRLNLVEPLYRRLKGTAELQAARNDLRPAIWRLRTSREGFMDGDDGWKHAKALLRELEHLGEEGLGEEKKALREAADAFEPSDDLLRRLRRARTNLLRRWTPEPEFAVEKADSSVMKLLEALRNCTDNDAPPTPTSHEDIVAELHRSLRYDPESMLEAIRSYNFVYAATNQQCMGNEIRKAKGARRRTRSRYPGDAPLPNAEEEEEVTSPALDPALFYDTVIVDEAAKSAPPDLMIPMALARRRIILVGDHRQLPHMIDELVEEEMTQAHHATGAGNPDSPISRLIGVDRTERTERCLRESMFERLKERLEELEKKDGIRRTITLDQQFRTHPVLGKLVSDNFYAPKNEAYGSPLGPEHFAHNLPEVANRCCVWISCGADGPERSGTSYANQQEARRVVHWLKTWMDSEAGRELTFGVISFYKGQILALKEAMTAQGMMQNGLIAAPYHYTPDSDDSPQGKRTERLRIGTVDSFQGMEFDVVILSMVRSSRNAGGDFPFGFLENPNRLCVALSRQKKMLVIAGDERLVDSQTCRARTETVAVLAQFYDYCAAERSILS